MSKKISVVIPTQNSEDTIFDCVKSVQNQTYENLEILVFDDGSEDTTGDIVEELMADDARIRLLRSFDCGKHNSKMFGADSAIGEYITFVEPDDYIHPEMCSTLIELIEEYNVEIACSGCKNVDRKGKIISDNFFDGKISVYSNDEAIEKLISQKLFSNTLAGKLYKIELLYDMIASTEEKYSRTLFQNFYLFNQVEKVAYIDLPFYNNIIDKATLIAKDNNIEICGEFIYSLKDIRESITEKPYSNLIDVTLADRLLKLYNAYIMSEDKIYKEKKDILQEIVNYKSKGFYKDCKSKRLVRMYRYFPEIYRYRCNAKIKKSLKSA